MLSPPPLPFFPRATHQQPASLGHVAFSRPLTRVGVSLPQYFREAGYQTVSWAGGYAFVCAAWAVWAGRPMTDDGRILSHVDPHPYRPYFAPFTFIIICKLLSETGLRMCGLCASQLFQEICIPVVALTHHDASSCCLSVTGLQSITTPGGFGQDISPGHLRGCCRGGAICGLESSVSESIMSTRHEQQPRSAMPTIPLDTIFIRSQTTYSPRHCLRQQVLPRSVHQSGLHL